MLKLVKVRLIVFVFIFLLLGSFSASSRDCCDSKVSVPQSAISSDDLSKFLDSVIPGMMQEEHIPGAVFVLVQNGKVVLSRGFGYANLEQKQPVQPESTIFPIGSISKVFTATALVQLADRNQIELNSDVNRYLKKVKVPTNFPQPVTGADLLRHTSGLDEIRPGTQAGAPDKILPLADFLKDRLVRAHPPGLITSYSTYGITLAGLLIEEISGKSYENYLKENIWKPLEMNRTHVSTPAQMNSDLAIPYAVEKDSPVRVDYEWYHTIPASSIRSTATDMANFLIAHLQCGKFGDQQILSQSAACKMHQRQSTTHSKMPGWAYGFQEDDSNGLRILEHGGDIAGFSSLLVLLPEQNTAFFISHHLEAANLRFKLKQQLLDRYFPDKRTIQIPKPIADSNVKRFAGFYRANLFCHTCKNPIPVAGLEVAANEDGTITVWEDRWIQTEPLLFVRADGKRKIGFQQDPSGKILQLSAGSWKVLEKVK